MRVVGETIKLLVCTGCNSVIEFDERTDSEKTYQINTSFGSQAHIDCPRCGHMINTESIIHRIALKIDSDIEERIIPI